MNIPTKYKYIVINENEIPYLAGTTMKAIRSSDEN
jgi:hypothetical protein